MCNKDYISLESKWWGLEQQVNIYLSDSTLKDVDGAGISASGIYALLEKRGIVAGLSSTVGGFVAAIIAIYWGAIKIQNDGCGVYITTRFIPFCPPCSTPTVHSQ